MRHRDAKTVAGILGLAILTLPAHFAEAQFAGDSVLNDVTVAADQGCTVVRVGFNSPVLYLRHFPYEAGSELLVFVRPIGLSPQELAAGLPWGIASVPPEGDALLLSVVFEGDAPAGPYLSVRFKRHVSFEVRQGRDHRSVTVSIPDSGLSGPCSQSR